MVKKHGATETLGYERESSGRGLFTPQFIRLPKAGHQCPHTGLSRAKLNQLILPCPENGMSPPVASVSLAAAGKKGTRLVDYDSLISFLRGHLNVNDSKAA